MVAVGLLMPAVGCGGERELDAGTLVTELNEAGAGLELGESLQATDGGVEVHVIRFDESRDPAAAEDHGHEHGAGAVVILDDADAARAEFERCESALSFVCFRAANAVLRFSEISPAERQRITGALRSLEAVER